MIPVEQSVMCVSVRLSACPYNNFYSKTQSHDLSMSMWLEAFRKILIHFKNLAYLTIIR